MAITYIWSRAVSEGKDVKLPVKKRDKSTATWQLNDYYYEEMIKRLNEVDFDKVSIGYFLRRMWHNCEDHLSVLEQNAYNKWYELSKEKLAKKTEIGFYKNSNGKFGVHSDLLYDTYAKKWSKAYQLTFYCFFRQIDYLADPEGNGFSYTHENSI
jgi:hypothetical protein